MSTEHRTRLITRNLQEVLGLDELNKLLANQDYVPTIYWGTAPTGKPHIGYLTPLIKIADFLNANCRVIVLLADVHAYLDMINIDFEVIKHRVEYYKLCIISVLKTLNCNVDLVEFVVGSAFQFNKDYVMDTMRLSLIVNEHDARKAGSEVVKQNKNVKLSHLIYPNLQALDEQHLGCDAQFGGVDQRKIFIHAEKYLQQLGYKKRIHLMNYMVPGLMGSKMSASDPNSKIDLFEEASKVEKKIRKAFCEEGNVEENGVLSFIKLVLFPINELKNVSEYAIEIRDGQPRLYSKYNELEHDFKMKLIHPSDLKQSVVHHLGLIMQSIKQNTDMEQLSKVEQMAYPQPTKK